MVQNFWIKFAIPDLMRLMIGLLLLDGKRLIISGLRAGKIASKINEPASAENLAVCPLLTPKIVLGDCILRGEPVDPKNKKYSKQVRHDPRANEKVSAYMGQLIKEKNLSSPEEVNALASEHIVGSSFDDLVLSGDTPIQQAQYKMYDAFAADTRKGRISLAKEALSICTDCADAYVLLAEEEANTYGEAIVLYRKGVEAGKKALGPEQLANGDHFWARLETRPYMRSLEGLAHCLWEIGEDDEATACWEELIRLNPNDNQGIRWRLALAYLTDERYADTKTLLAKFVGDITVCTVYTRAFVTYATEGNTVAAQTALKAANDLNPFVLPYFIGALELPDEIITQFAMGSEEEAINYVQEFGHLWSDEAINWFVNWFERKAAKKTFDDVFPDANQKGVVLNNVLDLNLLRKK